MSGPRRKHEEHENLERWLVSYADFITLCFAFFTVMYALSSTDAKKMKALSESLQRAFMPGSWIFPQKGDPFTPLQKSRDESQAPANPADSGQFSKADEEEIKKLVAELRDAFHRSTGVKMIPGEMGVIKTEDGFKIRLGESVFFKSGSAKLQRQYAPFLINIANKLKRLNYRIQVEGHTDAETANTDMDNWKLSLERAHNLMRFMIDGVGFPREKISVAGYGDTQPLADNDTPEGRAQNRRVEISVIVPRPVADNVW
jgi:chemotaxis protein MotB